MRDVVLHVDIVIGVQTAVLSECYISRAFRIVNVMETVAFFARLYGHHIVLHCVANHPSVNSKPSCVALASIHPLRSTSSSYLPVDLLFFAVVTPQFAPADLVLEPEETSGDM